MLSALLILFISLVNLSPISAQEVSFSLVCIDTLVEIPSDNELVIGNSSTFREVFYENRYAINAPRFQHTIYLQRTIQATCVQNINHQVTLDSEAQTLTWYSGITQGNCEELVTRQITIAVPRPPIGYEVQFDTSWIKQETKSVVPAATELALNSVSCQLDQSAGGSFYPVPAVITTDSLYTRYWLGEALRCTSKMDFSSELILANTYGGDCMMRLMPHAFFDPITNTLVLEVHNIWGGCRAGGRKPLALVVPRPPTEDFRVVFQEIQVDSWEEYNEQFLRKN